MNYFFDILVRGETCGVDTCLLGVFAVFFVFVFWIPTACLSRGVRLVQPIRTFLFVKLVVTTYTGDF